ncbi:histone deacetylase [Nocardia sp. NBC_00416]|uniref:histone deacetylase n=1 Tax=Nocardia sp. NBC_00416 TaxID=2975991 RepID=UPI002E1D8B65
MGFHDFATARPRAALDRPATPDLVWYAAYGSNANPARLTCYLTGTGPSGAARAAPTSPRAAASGRRGCRDRTPPAYSIGLVLPGLLYFATESAIWTGGRAFYDPAAPAETPVHAYLLTRGQFSDIAAQEMYRPAGIDLDLTEAVRTGRSRLGPGRYETLVCPGTYAGLPIVTCTAAWRWRDIGGNSPATAYLRHIATGLRAAHQWSIGETAVYLASRPGADGRWTADTVAALLTAPPATPPRSPGLPRE